MSKTAGRSDNLDDREKFTAHHSPIRPSTNWPPELEGDSQEKKKKKKKRLYSCSEKAMASRKSRKSRHVISVGPSLRQRKRKGAEKRKRY